MNKKYFLMGLFDFLFGSGESCFNTEDYRSIHEDRVIAQAVLVIGHVEKIGIVATTTTMVCRALVRMKIMIFRQKFAYL